jgi:hypothetical protein
MRRADSKKKKKKEKEKEKKNNPSARATSTIDKNHIKTALQHYCISPASAHQPRSAEGATYRALVPRDEGLERPEPDARVAHREPLRRARRRVDPRGGDPQAVAARVRREQLGQREARAQRGGPRGVGGADGDEGGQLAVQLLHLVRVPVHFVYSNFVFPFFSKGVFGLASPSFFSLSLFLIDLFLIWMCSTPPPFSRWRFFF